MSILYDRIDALCKKLNVSITTMCKDSGASRASLSDLKVGRKQTLSAATLDKIADYFDTTVDYLLGRSDDPENNDRFGLEPPEYWMDVSDGGEQEKLTAESSERIVDDDDIKFALFGDAEIDDELYEEVKAFARFAKERKEKRSN